MSDSAKSHEIEDVLSSVRRLVNDGGGRGRIHRAERLLLTPAQRVAVPESEPRAQPEVGPRPVAAVSTDRKRPMLLQPNPRDRAALERRIAELEAAVAQSDEEWEPDGDDTVTMPAAWAMGRPRPANAPQATPPVEEKGGLAGLDEEKLREMVAEIVREELQGVLGERITRNVRKLVRREISRALAARELD